MVGDAVRLKTRLARLIGEAQPVAVDVARLERIDTAAIQVLVAFVRDRDRQGLAVQWRGTSPALTAAVRLLGLSHVFGPPA